MSGNEAPGDSPSAGPSRSRRLDAGRGSVAADYGGNTSLAAAHPVEYL